eukprot:TRINITY_DN29077_c0_g1_i1.p1 TRINITY_DN29077_c0_g1~~TRINITY_DN29077_c0_g1_i1.p1  ORF type:complete len:358 (+),score=66.44 TRINITY_DN29077_c0_g1_i1:158-1231(+)
MGSGSVKASSRYEVGETNRTSGLLETQAGHDLRETSPESESLEKGDAESDDDSLVHIDDDPPVHIDVHNAAGNLVCSSELDSTATLADVKNVVLAQGGPPVGCQRFIIGGELHDDSDQTLGDIVVASTGERSTDDVCDSKAARRLLITVVMVPPDKENVALISKGARMIAEAKPGWDLKPLLNHDVAFPQLQYVAWWDDCDLQAAVPSEKRNALSFCRHLECASGGVWRSDTQQAYIVETPGQELRIHLGKAAKLSKVGFTYSLWDKNYGHGCSVLAQRQKDGAIVRVGHVHIPWMMSMQTRSPQDSFVRTALCDIPPAFQEDFYTELRFVFHEGQGRRLYFVFAIGKFVNDIDEID